MKKLFTIDDFMVAFISALGYGFGYTIPMYLGWPQPACIAVCFALGIFLNDKQSDRSEVETLASVRCKSAIKLRFIEERYYMSTRFSKTLKMLRTERADDSGGGEGTAKKAALPCFSLVEMIYYGIPGQERIAIVANFWMSLFSVIPLPMITLFLLRCQGS